MYKVIANEFIVYRVMMYANPLLVVKAMSSLTKVNLITVLGGDF